MRQNRNNTGLGADMKLRRRGTTRKSVGRLFMTVCIIAVWLLASYTWGSGSPDFKYLRVKHIRNIESSFNQPTEVAVADDGRTYVLDGANNKVKVFDARGALLFSFGRQGREPGDLDYPVGMDLDADGNVYVADTGNKRVQVFDRRGQYIRSIDLAPLNARPVEVKFMPRSGRVYVSDTENHQIHCFNSDGSPAFSLGGYGKGTGEFMYPGMIDTDAAGKIHVVDILNGRLQIFAPAGENPRQLGKFGIKPGSLFRPKGVLVDNRSRVYVSDSYTGVIQVFDDSGSLVAILSEDGNSPLHLTTPLGMALDLSKNQLYVVQAELNRISVFELRDGI